MIDDAQEQGKAVQPGQHEEERPVQHKVHFFVRGLGRAACHHGGEGGGGAAFLVDDDPRRMGGLPEVEALAVLGGGGEICQAGLKYAGYAQALQMGLQIQLGGYVELRHGEMDDQVLGLLPTSTRLQEFHELGSESSSSTLTPSSGNKNHMLPALSIDW